MPQARRTLIFEASTTNHIDSAPAWLSSSFCAPRPAIKWISRAVHGATHAASPAQRKKKMRCAQEANVSTRAQRSGDAQGGTADDGPGVVSQVVSQVVKNAPAREWRWRLGAWDSGEGSGRSDGVVVERGSRQIPAQWQRSLLRAGIRLASQGRLLRLVSSYASATACKHVGCESGWAVALTSTVCQLEVRCRR